MSISRGRRSSLADGAGTRAANTPPWLRPPHRLRYTLGFACGNMRASHAVFLALFMCVSVDGGKRAIDGTTRPACRTSRTAARLRGVDTKLVCTSVSWCGDWCACYSFAALSACHHEGDVIFEVDVPWVISLFPTVRHPYSRIVPPPPCSFHLL